METYENKQNRRGAWRDFAKGFFITLAVLLPVYLWVIVWAAGKNAEPDEQDVQAAAAPQQAVTVAARAYNLHLILQDTEGELMGSILVRFDAPQQTAQLTVLPAETVLLHTRRTVPAGELYTTLGALALQQAVEETLGVAVSGWCCVQADALLDELAAQCGELSLSLPQGRLSLTAAQLNAQLDAVQTPAAMTQLLQSAAAALLQALPADTLQEDILLCYQNAPPLRGNIDAAGIHALARAAAECRGAPAFTVVDIYPQGNWNEQERFVLADGSDRALQKQYGKAQSK